MLGYIFLVLVIYLTPSCLGYTVMEDWKDKLHIGTKIIFFILPVYFVIGIAYFIYFFIVALIVLAPIWILLCLPEIINILNMI